MNLLSDQVDIREIEVITRGLRCVLSKGIIGDVVELGCYVGTTSVYIAKILKDQADGRQFFVYDSFEGLPPKSQQDISPIGEQFRVGELIATKKQFIMNMKKSGVPVPIIKKGWFSDLTANDVPDKIAFAFLDGDYYSSIRDSLRVVEQHLQFGAVIVVDDYSNSMLPGVSRAVDEWLTRHKYSLRVEHSLAVISVL